MSQCSMACHFYALSCMYAITFLPRCDWEILFSVVQKRANRKIVYKSRAQLIPLFPLLKSANSDFVCLLCECEIDDFQNIFIHIFFSFHSFFLHQYHNVMFHCDCNDTHDGANSIAWILFIY